MGNVLQGPLPVLAVQSPAQVGLAAGAEVTLVISLNPPFLTPKSLATYAFSTFVIWSVFVVSIEANVMYVVEGQAGSNANNATVKVKNVGSAAGVSAWAVNGLFLGPGDALSI